ncbi:MAG: SRPBCC family protein [Gordonia sp. (in: high G+C Gram-positive bacteria)]
MPVVTEQFDLKSTDPDLVFERLSQLDRYPEIAPSVLSVLLEDTAEGVVSEWEVEFRGGTMRWREADVFDAEARTYRFAQIEGDVHELRGQWRVVADGDSVSLQLEIDFDLGMPSLADLVDPVAERALIDNMRAIAHAVDAECVAAAGAGR